jgi:hypothetical protein
MGKHPFNRVRFADAEVTVERRTEGTLILRSPHSLQDYPLHIGEHLRRWALKRRTQRSLPRDAGMVGAS